VPGETEFVGRHIFVDFEGNVFLVFAADMTTQPPVVVMNQLATSAKRSETSALPIHYVAPD
jgi:hypothetical protein